jgi:hypothetical protein
MAANDSPGLQMRDNSAGAVTEDIAAVKTPDVLNGLKLGNALLRTTLGNPEVQAIARPARARYPRYSHPFEAPGGVFALGEWPVPYLPEEQAFRTCNPIVTIGSAQNEVPPELLAAFERLGEAVNMFYGWLRDGSLTATGLAEDYTRLHVIPAEVWSCDGLRIDAEEHELRGPRREVLFRTIRLALPEGLRPRHQQGGGGNAGLQTQCAKWLRSILAEQLIREDVRVVAMALFEGLGQNQFDRAWQVAAPAGWKKAGAPGKSVANASRAWRDDQLERLQRKAG